MSDPLYAIETCHLASIVKYRGETAALVTRRDIYLRDDLSPDIMLYLRRLYDAYRCCIVTAAELRNRQSDLVAAARQGL